MNTSQKGNLAQSKVIARLVELGVSVFLPFGEGEKVDIIYIKDSIPIRGQIKHARIYKDCVTFNTCSLAYVDGRKTTRVGYAGHVDTFLVYCSENEEVYEVPEHETPKAIMSLRLSKPKNNQKKLVRYAKDYVM